MGRSSLAPRRYRSERRTAQAGRTRHRILAAATVAFLQHGYADTTMRAVAGAAGVSLSTVEASFGTKVAVLKAAIDVAIAGDDQPVPMLERDWAAASRRAAGAETFLALATGVIAASQRRSAGLVLAAFEGSGSQPDLIDLTERLVAQRAVTAAWLVDTLAEKALRPSGLRRQDAIDTLWVLMDPALFVRLTRHRGWDPDRYRWWLAHAAGRLLVGPAAGGSTPADEGSM